MVKFLLRKLRRKVVCCDISPIEPSTTYVVLLAWHCSLIYRVLIQVFWDTLVNTNHLTTPTLSNTAHYQQKPWLQQ
jgi:hypothetical protein